MVTRSVRTAVSHTSQQSHASARLLGLDRAAVLPMKLAFEFSSTQADRPVRLLYVSLSEATPVEIA